MLRPVAWVWIALSIGCAAGRADPTRGPEPKVVAAAEARAVGPGDGAASEGEDEEAVAWGTVRSEIEALLCIRKIDLPDGSVLDHPSYGDREVCGLGAPQDAVARAVEAAFVAARPALISLTAPRDAAREALARSSDPEVRLAAMRVAQLDETFLGMLIPRLHEALAAEGLTCADCPEAVRPERREVKWAMFEPYLAAHVWPKEVVTPTDARGRASGEAKLGAHVCVGHNGIAQLEAADPLLVRAGYLGAFHSEQFVQGVLPTLRAVSGEKAYQKLKSDAARTAFLREHVGQRLVADPAVRADVCATLRRFEPDTGIVVVDCDPEKGEPADGAVADGP